MVDYKCITSTWPWSHVSCKYPPCACYSLCPNKTEDGVNTLRKRWFEAHSSNQMRLNEGQLSITNQISGELYLISLSSQMQAARCKINLILSEWPQIALFMTYAKSSFSTAEESDRYSVHAHLNYIQESQWIRNVVSLCTYCLLWKSFKFKPLTYCANTATWSQQIASNLHHVLILAQTKLQKLR